MAQSQWGKVDRKQDSPIWAPAQVNKPSTVSKQTHCLITPRLVPTLRVQRSVHLVCPPQKWPTQ